MSITRSEQIALMRYSHSYRGYEVALPYFSSTFLYMFIAYGLIYGSGAMFKHDAFAAFLLSSFVTGVLVFWGLTKKAPRFVAVRAAPFKPHHEPYLFFTMRLACSLGLAFAFALISQVGIEEYFFVSRSARAAITREDFFLSVCDELNLGLFWGYTACNIFYGRQITLDYKLICLLLLSYGILTISLATTVGVGVALYFLLTARGRVKPRFIFVVAGGGLLTAIFWKPLLASFMLGSNFHLTDVHLPSEMTAWVDISKNIAGASTPWYESRYGSSFLDALVSIFIPFADVTSLSVAYMEAFLPEKFAKGGGRAFSLPLEAYVNYSYLGPAFIGAVVGLIFKCITLKARKSVFFLFLQIALASLLFKFFRSESYSIIKNLFWLQVVPVAFIFATARLFSMLNPSLVRSSQRAVAMSR